MNKILLAVFTLGTFMLAGCGSDSPTAIGNPPSGDNCSENVAYLQEGVDKYKQSLGNYPTDVLHLLNSTNGKGPFIKEVPKCPSGNIYIIAQGKVTEAPRQ